MFSAHDSHRGCSACCGYAVGEGIGEPDEGQHFLQYILFVLKVPLYFIRRNALKLSVSILVHTEDPYSPCFYLRFYSIIGRVAGTSPAVAQAIPSVLQRLAKIHEGIGLDGPQQLMDFTAPPVAIAPNSSPSPSAVPATAVAPPPACPDAGPRGWDRADEGPGRRGARRGPGTTTAPGGDAPP